MTTNGQHKLLLVESDANERRALSTLLSGSGFEVVPAVDYEGVCKALDSGVPEVAVISTKLAKGPSGFVAIRAFRARGGTSAVALLPEENFEEAISAFRLGVSDVLVKPPRASELISALRRGLGQHAPLAATPAEDEAEGDPSSESAGAEE